MSDRKTITNPGSDMNIDGRHPSSIRRILEREQQRYRTALTPKRRSSSVADHQTDLESLFSIIIRLRSSIPGLASELNPDEVLDLQSRLHAILDDLLMRAIMDMIDLQVSQVADLARRDPVTQLANRAAFDQRLTEEIERARIYKLNLSIILFDVDHFKRINDQFGHPSGDQVLREIASVIKSSLRLSDLVFRYGGDEFVALCPATSEHALTIIRPRIDRHLKAHFENSAIPGYIGTSAGAATYPIDGTEAGTIIGVADRRLYECKRERHFSAGA